MRCDALLAGASALALAAFAAGASARPPTVSGVVVVSGGTVRLMTAAGANRPVPARLRASPLGLSPDGRSIAVATGESIAIGAVSGGPTTTVLRVACPTACPYGSDPSFAWSPDARRIAVAATPERGATVLTVLDRSGNAQRSYALPAESGTSTGRAFHRLVSWSPDGTRLLLLQSSEYGPTAAVVLDLATGTPRVVHRSGPCDGPVLSWSPDGRFVSVVTEPTQDCSHLFEIVGAKDGRVVLRRTQHDLGNAGTSWITGAAWAPDGSHAYVSVLVVARSGAVTSRIDRLALGGRQSTLIGPTAGWLMARVAVPSALLFTRSAAGAPTVLYRRDSTTGRSWKLLSARGPIAAVVPVATMP